MKPKVCILDFSSGNVGSVRNLFKALTEDVQVGSSVGLISEATHLVLPGVGSFGAAIKRIYKHIPMDVLEKEVFINQKPFLGICVGMQVLASKGYEFGEFEGLGWIPGVVKKLNCGNLPLPHIGWNNIQTLRDSYLLFNFKDNQDFYFVHSYYFEPENQINVIATTEYGQEFPSIIAEGNIFGVQFHPEKSQKAGKLLITNFLQVEV